MFWASVFKRQRGCLIDSRHHFGSPIEQTECTLCECGHYRVALNSEVSDFWQQYWSTARLCAPQLGMRKPRPNSPRRGSIKFHPLGLPSGVSLIHKLSCDSVDLEFDHFGRRLEELDRIYGVHLGRRVSIVRVGRSAAIRVPVPNVNPKLPFGPQEQSVLAVINTTQERLDWLKGLLGFHIVHHPGHRPT
jgi:hypothetical protein